MRVCVLLLTAGAATACALLRQGAALPEPERSQLARGLVQP
jgi:hypothetical protein